MLVIACYLLQALAIRPTFLPLALHLTVLTQTFIEFVGIVEHIKILISFLRFLLYIRE